MIVLLANQIPFTVTPNAGVVNAAGQVWDTAAKAFEASPSPSVTTPAIHFGAGIYAAFLLVNIPGVPWPTSAGNQWLLLTDPSTNLPIIPPIAVPVPGAANPSASVQAFFVPGS